MGSVNNENSLNNTDRIDPFRNYIFYLVFLVASFLRLFFFPKLLSFPPPPISFLLKLCLTCLAILTAQTLLIASLISNLTSLLARNLEKVGYSNGSGAACGVKRTEKDFQLDLNMKKLSAFLKLKSSS